MISISAGVVAGFSFYFIFIMPRKVKRIMEVKRFTEILTEDTMLRMSKNVAARVPFDEIPGNIDEALKKYYPRLPAFKKLFNLPVSELRKRVDWVIDIKKSFPEETKNEK